MFTSSTAPNTRTHAVNISGTDEELDRRSPVARPIVCSNRRTGAARKFDFVTVATARDAANQGVRVISATKSNHEFSFSPSPFATKSTIRTRGRGS